MSSPMAANAILDRVYLDIRCRLLDVAAMLDRIERSEGGEGMQNDPRWKQLMEGIAILERDGANRAEQVQMLFSDPYVAGWNRRNGEKRDEGRGSKIEDRR